MQGTGSGDADIAGRVSCWGDICGCDECLIVDVDVADTTRSEQPGDGRAHSAGAYYLDVLPAPRGETRPPVVGRAIDQAQTRPVRCLVCGTAVRGIEELAVHSSTGLDQQVYHAISGGRVTSGRDGQGAESSDVVLAVHAAQDRELGRAQSSEDDGPSWRHADLQGGGVAPGRDQRGMKQRAHVRRAS
jgi:hypothetical protein